MPDKVRIEYVELGKVARWPRNPKLHDHDQLGKSIERFGFVQPLTVDERTGQLVAGHGRLETLQKLKDAGGAAPSRIQIHSNGEWLVPVLRGVSFKDEQEAEAYLLADNRISEVGGWDDTKLAEMLGELTASGATALDGVGWDLPDVDAILRSVTSPKPLMGFTPEQKLERYQNAEIKQVILYYEGEEFDQAVARLGKVAADNGLESNTDAVNFLLDHYEANSSSKT